ncbi:hypothetical protein BKG92_02310 [Rodentibacter ratti]|uniref:Bacterial Ig domain-containing protein n=1 Tax=Rodentibacter ratti TaxID=1906745 RepID=A0A1V3L147_9PAST|nr:hypothetical protein [Rodentibacter ratti]OOF83686.1 hypothetical protein BKG92_02310 [Rodentibacter ratti]
MSTTLKVLSAKKVIASHQINSGDTLVIDARDKSNYQLVDDQTGLGPQNIIAKREGKDLKIFLEDGDMNPDVVIKGYYGDENSEEVTNLIVGQHENGGIYAYVPESGLKADAVSMLAEEVAAPQALGGEDLGSAFWAFNPWWLLALVPLAAGIAIAAGSGGSSGSGNNGNNGNNDASADKPTIASKDNDGTVTVTPGEDNNKVEVTFKDENGNDKTVVAEKGADGKWSIPDAGDTGATVDPDTGVITIPSDKVKDGEPVNATGTNEAGKTADADPVNAGTDAQPEDPADKPTITSPDNDGTVTVKPGDDNNKVEVTFTGEDDQPKTVVAEKGEDGKWSIPDAGDTGATVDPDTGVITIPSDKVKDGEPVNAKGTNDAGNTADADAVNAGTDAQPEDPADKPTIESPNNDGKVTVTPGEDNNKVEVTFKDEDGNEKTVVAEKGDDGKWSIPDAGDTGATVDPDTGVITIPSDKVKDGEPVNAKGTNDAGNTADADAVNAGTMQKMQPLIIPMATVLFLPLQQMKAVRLSQPLN